MLGNTLQTRLLIPVSAFVLVLVVGGALMFSRAESNRIQAEMEATAETQIEGVEKILGVTDALVMQQVRGAMQLLIQRGKALGPAALGAEVQLKDKRIPTLLLGGHSQVADYALVDDVTQLLGGTATLFVKSGEDFVRVSTNVKRDGERAVATVLDANGKAMAALREGKAFYGLVDILGNPYLTGYEPMRDAQGALIGVWYVGYKLDMEALKAVVEKSQLLQTGFVALVDGKGKARFHPPRIQAEQVEKLAQSGEAGWKVTKHTFESWGFSILAAYPDAEVSAITRGRMIAIVFVGLIGSVIMIGLIAVLLRRLVLTPLGGEPDVAAEMTRRIAAGDLTSSIFVKSGDTKSLVASIKLMQEELRQMVETIQRTSGAVVTSAAVVSDMSSRISSGAIEQHDATASIAATLEEITVSISHISDNADSAHQMAANAGQLSEAGNRVVGEAAEEMHRSAAAVNQSAEQVEQLGESSRAISAIVNVIKEIAEQTNLLALNAAIEAARAGEAGRGFAVVADEVRKLAERTALSTQEITGMIGNIQNRTSDAIEGISIGTGLVNASVEKAGEASTSMASIGTATLRLGDAVASISDALKEQRVASEEIARRVDQVASVNESNSASVKNMADQAAQLERLADELKAAVNIFRM